jgi:hypothetical protein
MSSKKTNPSSGNGKTSRDKSRNPKRTINPDKLVSDINQQTEALNNIIKKFSEPGAEDDKPKNIKNKDKSKNK